MYHKMHSVAAVFEETWWNPRETKSYVTIKAELVIKVPATTSEWPYKENCGRQLQVELARNGAMHENAAMYPLRVYMFHEVVWLTYVSSFTFVSPQLDNMRTLKLTPCCNFKCMQEIVWLIFTLPNCFYRKTRNFDEWKLWWIWRIEVESRSNHQTLTFQSAK